MKRYINVALILTDGCTASSQVWTDDRADAGKELERMMRDAVLQRNPALLGAVCDGTTIYRYHIIGGNFAKLIPTERQPDRF